MTASAGAALWRVTVVDPSSARRAHARELPAGRLGMRVVALSADAPDHVVRTLMDAGVEGIVSSRESEGVVLAVVDAVRRGARAWSPRTRAKLDVRTKTELSQAARDDGLLPPGPPPARYL
ncbi:response regulator transcription factor [Microbacterium hominis]|uniref:Uncharacterized protein n=1 Tax=Microbacterium hominis TaxID=162426 RepID=A0A0B4DUM3_9MICO|nr:response regulator transcription factor [Microbacterium hominis]KIC57943.1 hypothetical protein RM52_07635 [Microbacterium hominis]